jgi:hypothetical protein
MLWVRLTAGAANHVSGRDLDGAVAGSSVDWIGAEMAKRVEAGLRAGSSGSGPLVGVRPPGRRLLGVGVDIFLGIGGIVSLVGAIVVKSDVVVTTVVASWPILVAASRGPALVRMYCAWRRG